MNRYVIVAEDQPDGPLGGWAPCEEKDAEGWSVWTADENGEADWLLTMHRTRAEAEAEIEWRLEQEK